MRRAQTSTEYLVILSVVIVLALIVVGVLGGFAGIGGGASTRSSQLYWQQGDISIIEHEFSANAADSYMKIRNNLPHDINLVSVTVGSVLFYSGSVALSPGETFGIESATFNQGVNCTAGADYSYDMVFNYTQNTGATYSFDGESTSLRGTCAAASTLEE